MPKHMHAGCEATMIRHMTLLLSLVAVSTLSLEPAVRLEA